MSLLGNIIWLVFGRFIAGMDYICICDQDWADAGEVSLSGSYPAPPGPDWGWRIEVAPGDGLSFEMRMYNVTPDGQDALAVPAPYARI